MKIRLFHGSYTRGHSSFVAALGINTQRGCIRDIKVCAVSVSSDNIEEGFKLMENHTPSSPNEHILKGIVHTLIGQQQMSVSL